MPLLKIAQDKVTDNQPINTKVAEKQEEYATLPANYAKGVMAFAFELSEEDLKNIQKNKRVYVLLQTGGPAMPPINVGVDPTSFDDAVEYTRLQMTKVEGES
jgi:hypothetical protein